MPTLAPSCAQVILRLSECLSGPSAQLKSAHTSIDLHIEAGARVEVIEASQFITLLTSESRNLDIGLNAYELFHPGQLNSQMYAIMSSSTLGEALRTAAHFSSLLSDGTPLFIYEGANQFSVNFLRMESLPVDRQYIDCCMSTFMGLVHWLLPLKKPVPIAAAFSYSEPEDSSNLQRIFGAALSFSHISNKITFSPDDWNTPLTTASPTLKLHHEEYANAELAQSTTGLLTSVKNHIFIGLASGEGVSLQTVAGKLNLSTRALLNRLDNESASFRYLLDECRNKLAIYLLSSTDQNITSISRMLGFSEPSSFHRACNRWFGCTASAYRSNMATVLPIQLSDSRAHYSSEAFDVAADRKLTQ